MTVTGVDVAKYQPTNYSTTGLDFVVVKATEGTGYVNPRHDDQVEHARAHGLIVGHYHFARPGSVSGQADYFLTHAQPRPGDFLAFDWEDAAVSGADKDAWLRYVLGKAPGLRTILYCNRDFWLHRDHTSYCADGLWIADPSAPKGQPRVEHPWLFHQYSETGGIDHNLGNFTDRAALRAWAAKTTPTPATKPTPAPTVQEDDDMPLTDQDAAKVAHAIAAYSHGDKPDVHQTWQDAAANASAALAQARQNGSGLSALAAKVDKLAATAAPEIDYAKLAAALLAAVKES
ncbi:glycoside hydrolase family 25 protein [Streptomyces sp. NPDC020983]|uniref:glycoside hydrolase family 25 protein n=1 Tax=Streptomyces sp. NPDC020983 TaxID=3365106 RepID=UPI00378CCD8D